METLQKVKQTKQQMLIQEAHGKLVALLVGVDEYEKESGFPRLKTCSNDAMWVKNTLEDVPQLNADKSRLSLVTSKHKFPSRNVILGELKKLVGMTSPEDRLLFYFSGHGYRFKENQDKFYLVPQDVYDDSDPAMFIDFEEVVEIVESSPAKVKMIVVDSCFSGPSFSCKKSHAATYSPKFLQQYLQKTAGVVVIASSSEDQESFTKSPHPELSLFTHYFVKALSGEPDALDNELWLTVDSLFAYLSVEIQRTAKSYQKSQSPVIKNLANGIVHLGNFKKAMLQENIPLSELPIVGVEFKVEDKTRTDVRDILTKISQWHYSEEWIERTANKALPEYLEEDFGVKAANLVHVMGVSEGEVGIYGSEIRFPGGEYCCEYMAMGKKAGKLVHTLSLRRSMPGERIPAILEALDMYPTSFTAVFEKDFNPRDLLPSLKVAGWKVESLLSEKIEFTQGGYKLRVEPGKIIMSGISPRELFSADCNKDKVALATSVLGLAS